MVRLKFIVLNDAIVLRISEGYERYYKSVKNILINNPNVVRHWKADKEWFFNFAASSQENNKILDDFKQKYKKVCVEHLEYIQCIYVQILQLPCRETQVSTRGNWSSQPGNGSFVLSYRKL